MEEEDLKKREQKILAKWRQLKRELKEQDTIVRGNLERFMFSEENDDGPLWVQFRESLTKYKRVWKEFNTVDTQRRALIRAFTQPHDTRAVVK